MPKRIVQRSPLSYSGSTGSLFPDCTRSAYQQCIAAYIPHALISGLAREYAVEVIPTHSGLFVPILKRRKPRGKITMLRHRTVEIVGIVQSTATKWHAPMALMIDTRIPVDVRRLSGQQGVVPLNLADIGIGFDAVMAVMMSGVG